MSQTRWILRARDVFCKLTFLVPVLLVLLALYPGWLFAERSTRLLKQEGQRYYFGKGVPRNLAKSFRLYLEAAKRGDSEAQYIAGGMYFRGMGTEVNYYKAFRHLHGAALKGQSTPESQKLLGEFFLKGNSIPQNYKKAVKWYEQAAKNGDKEAQVELGYLYFAGRGVEQDFEKSFYWFKKAAYQGLATAQYSLGIMWYSGNGVKEADSVNSYAWLSVAAANNHPDAIVARNYIAESLGADELIRAQDMATLLHEKTQMNIP